MFKNLRTETINIDYRVKKYYIEGLVNHHIKIIKIKLAYEFDCGYIQEQTGFNLIKGFSD